jgi:hypothetical protein
MTGISESAQDWLGLCPKSPVFRASQAGSGDQPESAHEGGAGRQARRIGNGPAGNRGRPVRKKTLARNHQFPLFTFLAGLVPAGNAIGQAALRYIGRIMQHDIIVSHALNLLIGFATLFCLVFLDGSETVRILDTIKAKLSGWFEYILNIVEFIDNPVISFRSQ